MLEQKRLLFCYSYKFHNPYLYFLYIFGILLLLYILYIILRSRNIGKPSKNHSSKYDEPFWRNTALQQCPRFNLGPLHFPLRRPWKTAPPACSRCSDEVVLVLSLSLSHSIYIIYNIQNIQKYIFCKIWIIEFIQNTNKKVFECVRTFPIFDKLSNVVLHLFDMLCTINGYFEDRIWILYFLYMETYFKCIFDICSSSSSSS